MTFEEDTKRFNALAKQRIHCKHCGHSITFYKGSYKDKIICSYCGRYIYKNGLIEFKEKLKKYQKMY